MKKCGFCTSNFHLLVTGHEPLASCNFNSLRPYSVWACQRSHGKMRIWMHLTQTWRAGSVHPFSPSPSLTQQFPTYSNGHYWLLVNLSPMIAGNHCSWPIHAEVDCSEPWSPEVPRWLGVLGRFSVPPFSGTVKTSNWGGVSPVDAVGYLCNFEKGAPFFCRWWTHHFFQSLFLLLLVIASVSG